MLKLYGSARSRASIVQWYLEELGITYEFVLLDLSAGEHRQPAYLSINPMGKVPAIVDGYEVRLNSYTLVMMRQEAGGRRQEAEGRRNKINLSHKFLSK